MKRIAVLLGMSLFLIGCSLSAAAKLMKTFDLSLSAYQNAELSAYQAGFITPAAHVHNQHDIEVLATDAISVNKALLASDKGTVIQGIGNAVTVVEEIEANDVTAIGDPTKKAAIEVAAAALQNLLAQIQLQMGVKN